MLKYWFPITVIVAEAVVIYFSRLRLGRCIWTAAIAAVILLLWMIAHWLSGPNTFH